MNNTRSASLVLALSFSVAACAVDPASTAPAPDAPAATTAVTDPPTAAPRPIEPVLGAPSRVTGEVLLTQWADAATDAAHHPTAMASLWETDGRALAQGCRTTSVAGCEVRRCDAGVEAEPVAEEARVSAGALRVGGLDLGELTFLPDASRSYGMRTDDPVAWSLLDAHQLWRGGERLSLRADGAGRGATSFDLDAVAPAPVTVTSASYEGRRLGRGLDGLAIDWTGGDGVVRMQLAGSGERGETVRVRCDFPADAGHALMPAEAFQQVEAGQGVWVYVMSTSTARVRTDALDLSFVLKHVARAERVVVE